MSKIKDFVNKGVRLIVTDTEGEAPPPPEAREIEPETFEVAPPKTVARSAVAADVADFGAVYEEAGIELPLHGYGIDKVAEMLESKRLATLQREVKATAVLAALEAASVPIRDVIEDAVKRDKALDAFEAAKGREAQELRGKSEVRLQAIRGEIEAFLKEKNGEMEGIKNAREAADRAILDLQTRKRREEQRLFDVVAHFIEGGENPITTTPGSPAAAAAAAAAPLSPPPPKSTPPDQA
jgi:regulator of extracellular matrix RemA (YlzA/DUF370 family)